MQALRTIKSAILATVVMVLGNNLFAQAWKTFSDTRIVHGHSVETGTSGSMKFVIGHRFGAVNGGFYEFFGLDQASTRLSLDYSASNNLAFGLGRSSYLKTFDGYAKWSIAKQEGEKHSFPVSITWMTNMTLNSIKWANPNRKNYFTSRLGYAHQLLIARKFGQKLSVQVAPTMVHRNLVTFAGDKHDIFAVGVAARYKLKGLFGLNFECFLLPPGQLPPVSKSAVSVGFDIKTERHAFQIFVSNSRNMVERYIITETTGDLAKADLFIGFNISRDFQLKH
jgi:hypothetical protein